MLGAAAICSDLDYHQTKVIQRDFWRIFGEPYSNKSSKREDYLDANRAVGLRKTEIDLALAFLDNDHIPSDWQPSVDSYGGGIDAAKLHSYAYYAEQAEGHLAVARDCSAPLEDYLNKPR